MPALTCLGHCSSSDLRWPGPGFLGCGAPPLPLAGFSGGLDTLSGVRDQKPGHPGSLLGLRPHPRHSGAESTLYQSPQ